MIPIPATGNLTWVSCDMGSQSGHSNSKALIGGVSSHGGHMLYDKRS